VFGGPVTKKNTRFLCSFERQMTNATKESHFAVPTVVERGFKGSGDGQFDPASELSTPTSTIGDAFLSLVPFPNKPNGADRDNTSTQAIPADARSTISSVRLDHSLKAFGRDHILTGRYNFANDDTILPVTGEAIFSSLRALVRTQNLSLFLNSVFSP